MTVFFINGLLFSASKKNKTTAAKNKSESNKAEESQNLENVSNENSKTDGAVKLSSQKRTFFYKINENIVSEVENGSPESLRNAMQQIKKPLGDYEENEKILISVATEIMKNVWPSQKITWENVAPAGENQYLGAINSAKQGVFDSSTGNFDFLSTLLPAVVLVNPALNRQNSQNQKIFDDCSVALEKALKINQNSVLANYLTAILLTKREKFSESLAFLEKAYQKSPATDEIALCYANSLFKTKNFQLAQTILNNFDSDENKIEVLKQKANIAFELKNYDDAEFYVAKVLQQNPNNLEFILFRAKILVEKKDYIRAVSLLDIYARQDDAFLDYLILRAKIQLDWSKNSPAAAETIEKALQFYPENIEVLTLAAKISSLTDLPVAGKYADELAEKVLQKEPTNADAMTYSLNAFIQRENWNEAYKICKKIIETENFSPEIVGKFVQICLKLGKKSEAYDFSKSQYLKYPEDENILQAYALAYSKVGNQTAVLKYIDSLLAESSPKTKSYLYYVRSFLQATDEKVLADLRSSLSMNPRNSDALFRLYEIYYEKQDYRKAQYYLRQVVAINPNNSFAQKLNEALTKLVQ